MPRPYRPFKNRGYVEKGTVDGTERNYVQLILEAGAVKEKKLTETVGSDKGKMVPTDIGMIVNDFLVDHFRHYSRLQLYRQGRGRFRRNRRG